MLTLAVQQETTNFSVWWAPSKSHQPQDKQMMRPVARRQVVAAWQKALKSPWRGDWRSSTRLLWTAAETRGAWVWVITRMKTQTTRHFTLTRRLPNQWNYKVSSYSIISGKDEFISIHKVNKKVSWHAGMLIEVVGRFKQRRSQGQWKRKNKNGPNSSHLDRPCLVNKAGTKSGQSRDKVCFCEQSGKFRAAKKGLFCPLGSPIRTQLSPIVLPACGINYYHSSYTRIDNWRHITQSLLGSIFWLSTKVISHFPLDCLRVTSLHSTNKLPLRGPVLVDFTT